MSTKRVLVVGTTADYIEAIRGRQPGRALFLTDLSVRLAAGGEALEPQEELVCDLTCRDQVITLLREHLEKWDIELEGITCFDCDTLPLAAQLAPQLELPFSTPEAVARARSKFESKRLWREAGLPCPDARLLETVGDVDDFCLRVPGPVVVKPDGSSGSRLVFKCRTAEEARDAFLRASEALATPIKAPEGPVPYGALTRDAQRMMIERFVPGQEYSADFLLEGRDARFIRLARKIMHPRAPTGTVLGYEVPAELPHGVSQLELRVLFIEAARCLGLERAIVMVDFMIVDKKPVLLEMTPRPGGDCLPPLIRSSSGVDVLAAALDFAAVRPVVVPPASRWRVRVGLRLLAQQEGVIRRLDDLAIRNDLRVVECRLSRGTGHEVILPPDDYDSRVLGYAIFVPTPRRNLTAECCELNDMLVVRMVHQKPPARAAVI